MRVIGEEIQEVMANESKANTIKEGGERMMDEGCLANKSLMAKTDLEVEA